jgi:hypothetical protein
LVEDSVGLGAGAAEVIDSVVELGVELVVTLLLLEFDVLELADGWITTVEVMVEGAAVGVTWSKNDDIDVIVLEVSLGDGDASLLVRAK